MNKVTLETLAARVAALEATNTELEEVVKEMMKEMVRSSPRFNAAFALYAATQIAKTPEASSAPEVVNPNDMDLRALSVGNGTFYFTTTPYGGWYQGQYYASVSKEAAVALEELVERSNPTGSL